MPETYQGIGGIFQLPFLMIQLMLEFVFGIFSIFFRGPLLSPIY